MFCSVSLRGNSNLTSTTLTLQSQLAKQIRIEFDAMVFSQNTYQITRETCSNIGIHCLSLTYENDKFMNCLLWVVVPRYRIQIKQSKNKNLVWIEPMNFCSKHVIKGDSWDFTHKYICRPNRYFPRIELLKMTNNEIHHVAFSYAIGYNWER